MAVAGLLEKSGSTYALTSLGQSAYDAKVNGFCYTERYEIKDITIVKEEDKSALLVMFGSMLAGVLLSFITGERLAVALALSTGFGWFSLSGALAGQHLGDAYGSLALLNDLMRELIGLTVVFILGRNFANSSVGVCGATAMDTTMPFVRKACHYEYVPTAIISGLILTIAAPFFMLFFLSFAQ